MIGITRTAQSQISDLVRFYIEEKGRPEAALRLLGDLAEARDLIVAAPDGGLAHPRPYPGLLSFGLRWILVRAYWIGWRVIDGRPVVTNLFHVSADIEGRATPEVDEMSDW